MIGIPGKTQTLENPNSYGRLTYRSAGRRGRGGADATATEAAGLLHMLHGRTLKNTSSKPGAGVCEGRWRGSSVALNSKKIPWEIYLGDLFLQPPVLPVDHVSRCAAAPRAGAACMGVLTIHILMHSTGAHGAEACTAPLSAGYCTASHFPVCGSAIGECRGARALCCTCCLRPPIHIGTTYTHALNLPRTH